ncbi:MAG: dihydropteroate synthase [Wenzhouxiangellaceae bacterium]|nr:dihydropteroate synthase [Wenzhouxiangellaceae bacterium]
MMAPLAQTLRQAAAAERVLVMGIVNVTPDSFSDGGRYDSVEAALQLARRLVDEGADILDVGGESTRPGAAPVSAADEIERVVPVIDAIGQELDVPISIDTMKAEVMRAAVEHGALMINDVNALRDPQALETAAALDVPVCLMHMQGEPRTMQQSPAYDDVVEDLLAFFRQRIAACLEAGIAEENLLIDPGFGFGKTMEHNLKLLDQLARFRSLHLPIVCGISRKSMLGRITGRERADQRVVASVAAAVLAAERGADILRVHDVAETMDAVKVIHALRAGRKANER